jgi:hypothetical protein
MNAPLFGSLTSATNFDHCTKQTTIAITASAGTAASQIITTAGGGTNVYICHLSFAADLAFDWAIQSGTGAACATGTSTLTGTYQETLRAALDYGYTSSVRSGAANDNVCLNITATATTLIGGFVKYDEF